MKKIVFPATSRVHLSRQKLLLEELSKDFDVTVWEPGVKNQGNLSTYALLCAVEFNNFLAGKDYGAAIIRADRFELLNLAGLCAYKGIPIIHIEGGCESGQGVIDSRVRHAISQLADIHLVTDESARKKVVYLGAEPDKVFNVGSLDVSFAKQIVPQRIIEEDYILLLHHSLPGEDSTVVYTAVKDLGYRVVGVKSNTDYQASLMTEEFSPEDFISLMYYAKCFVGNSSALCKESSILGTPGVLTGRRQDGRIVGHNVLRVPHNKKEIQQAVEYQINHGRYSTDKVYYKKNTEKLISKILKKEL